MDKLETIRRNIKILIVDDYAATRDLIRAILRSIGFTEISQAENGQDAITHLRQELVELVICDWNMPHVTGLEVLKYVRGDSRLAKIPFIMLTAEAYMDSVNAAVEAGVTDYIAKPFTADILIKKLAGALSSKESQKD